MAIDMQAIFPTIGRHAASILDTCNRSAIPVFYPTELETCGVAHDEILDGEIVIVARLGLFYASVGLLDLRWRIECAEETVYRLKVSLPSENKGADKSTSCARERHSSPRYAQNRGCSKVEGKGVTYVVLQLTHCRGDRDLQNATLEVSSHPFDEEVEPGLGYE